MCLSQEAYIFNIKMTKQEKIEQFRLCLIAFGFTCEAHLVPLIHEIHEGVFNEPGLFVERLAQLGAMQEKKQNSPQIENAPPLISILSLQSNFDVADAIQALIDGERFPNCGDSVIENLKQIKFNRPAIAQRLIDDIIGDFTAADTIQYSAIRLEESKAIFIGHA